MKVPFQLDEFYLDLQEDGNKVRILSQEEITKGPFPGLRPFKTSEFQLFYGRMGQGEELTKRLKKNHFLAVIGSSGTGKSSLVRAGLIPQLFGGYLHGAGSKWDIAICRPGKDPVENLAVALAASKARSKDNEKIKAAFDEIEPMLNDSLYGLLDAKQMFEEGNTTGNDSSNLLVIIDQFEELFRFDRKDLGKENIENQFVNLLLKASHDPSRAVYVIITMRSEFLGDCVKYRGLPEAINEGQYLVPQLTRNELKEVIEAPIKLAGKAISPNLVELLINEIEESKLKENLDQLPILQHALMRTYNNAAQEGADVMIEMRHYEAVGEMNKALANHAEDKFRLLGDADSNEKQFSKKQQIAKIIFQSLTELSSDKKSGRRPTELRKIYDVAVSLEARDKEVDEVVNHFRDANTSFIMPPINIALNPDIILDISHESLMRNWSRLNNWLSEEMKYKALYRQLNERREQHEQDNEEWLRGTLLRDLLDWRMTYANNATWASRYQQLPGNVHDEQWHRALYKSNISFLNESEIVHEKNRQQEAKDLKANIAREQKSQEARNRIKVLTLGLVMCGLFATWAFREKYNSGIQEEKAIKNEKQAVENEKKATYQKHISDSIAIVANLNADAARAERIIAQEQRALAEGKAGIIEKQKKEVEAERNKALAQTKIAEQQTALAKRQSIQLAALEMAARQQKDSAVEKNEQFEKQFVKNALKKESFYFSKSLDQATKDEIIDSLFETPSFDPTEIQLGKHINLEVLMLINQAVHAKEEVMENPAASLSQALAIWKTNQHPVIKRIVLSIVNDNVFPVETVESTPGGKLLSATLSVSGADNSFLIADANNLITGKTQNGKIKIAETSYDADVSRFYCSINDSGIKARTLMYAGFNENSMPQALIDSFRIQFAGNGNISSVSVSPLIKNYTFSKMSHNGKRILLADRDGTVSVWKAADDNEPERMDTLRNFRGRGFTADNVLFSPGNRHLLLFSGKATTLLNEKLEEVKTGSSGKIDAAIYTSNGKIITASNDKLSVRDSLLYKDSSMAEIDMTALAFKEALLTPASISTIALSPNWKKAVLTQSDGGVFLLQSKTGDSLFKKDSGKDNITVKELIGNKDGHETPAYNQNFVQATRGRNNGRVYAGFSNDSTIITANETGALKIWGIYTAFTDPELAIKTVYPKQTLHQKLESGKTNAADIIAAGKPEELNYAANYYFRQEKNDTAQLMYEKLEQKAAAEMKPYYLSRLIDINNELINVARIASVSKIQTPLTIKEYRLRRAILMKQNIEHIKKQLTLCSQNYTCKNNLSNTYGSLAFSLLFINDFEGAVAAADSGLRHNPANDWINTNLALANLLLGKYEVAEKIYLQYKDELFGDRSRAFKEAFLSDIRDVEKAGVFANRRQVLQVEAIKKLLN